MKGNTLNAFFAPGVHPCTSRLPSMEASRSKSVKRISFLKCHLLAFLFFSTGSFAWHGPIVIVKNFTDNVVDYYFSYKAGFLKSNYCERVAIPPRQTIRKDFSNLRDFEYSNECKGKALNQISPFGTNKPFDNCFIDVFNVPYDLSTTVMVAKEGAMIRCRYLPHGFGLR